MLRSRLICGRMMTTDWVEMVCSLGCQYEKGVGREGGREGLALRNVAPVRTRTSGATCFMVTSFAMLAEVAWMERGVNSCIMAVWISVGGERAFLSGSGEPLCLSSLDPIV